MGRNRLSQAIHELNTPTHLHNAGLFLHPPLCLCQLLPQCVQVHTGSLQEQPLNITTQQLEHSLKLNNLQRT
jgi:hypothetical protein